ncbi:hypothetical protein [Streptomyces sp. NPDC050856]|uniref:hypothetical protein n=1 Tax=Streptomyces sp. NPDC050856 TaxID=3154939 RepID=UPI0033F45BDF
MPADLTPLIAATAQWLTRAYPSGGGALDRVLAQTQARQAATVAAWLRYPTELDAALVTMAGPGGSGRLDRITGADGSVAGDPERHPWRTWVDEVVASWAACLLGTPGLAGSATAALSGSGHLGEVRVDFRRLVAPDEHDLRAAALLRHPDLLAPVAELHRAELLVRLKRGTALTG